MKSTSLTVATLLTVAAFTILGDISGEARDITNIIGSLEDQLEAAYPKMVFGGTTNFVRGDVNDHIVAHALKPLATSIRAEIGAKDGIIHLSGQPLKVVKPAHLYVVRASRSPHWIWVGVPPFKQSVNLSMTNAGGLPVERTTEGADLGQPLTLQTGTAWIKWGGNNRNPWFVVPHELIKFASGLEKNASGNYFVVDPTRYFSIKAPGVYKMTVTLRLYVVGTNTYLRPITLPPVTVPVRVETGQTASRSAGR